MIEKLKDWSEDRKRKPTPESKDYWNPKASENSIIIIIIIILLFYFLFIYLFLFFYRSANRGAGPRS